MKHSQASLTDQQVRTTFFIVPESLGLYAFVLGQEGDRQFQVRRQNLRAAGGELLLIGWPDGTTITFSRDDRTAPIDLDTLAATYSASAALHRICNPKASA